MICSHGNLCWAPVKDFHLSDVYNLTEVILPFLTDADFRQEPAVVLCAGGLERTGYVLAAWLVHRRRYGVEQALAEVGRHGLFVIPSYSHLMTSYLGA